MKSKESYEDFLWNCVDGAHVALVSTINILKTDGKSNFKSHFELYNIT